MLLATVIVMTMGLNEDFDKFLVLARTEKAKKKAMRKPKNSLSRKIRALNRRRKVLIVQAEMPENIYRLMTVACIFAGVFLGKAIFNSLVFMLLLGALGSFAPLIYLSFLRTKNRNSRIEKLRSSMMILSSSYIVTEDFLKSVQDNIELLEYPKPFRDFLTYCRYIDGNTKIALRRLENHVCNSYFSQWIDVLIMAQDDRSLKYVTMSVVEAMNDVAQAQMESDTAIYAVWREYFMVLALIFSAPLIFKVLMPSAYEILTTSFIGQGFFVLLIIAVVFSLVRALKLNKPILM